jgi:8-oxo-dGTP pyrophosphatase MutT (NUDIX family)
MSNGIVAFTKTKNKLKYLLICRKDTLGYVDFLRGKYSLYDEKYIKNLIDEMTISEKQKLLEHDFNYLWKELWGGFNQTQYKSEEKIAEDKFNQLKEGMIIFNRDEYSLKSLIESSKTNWVEPEWGFPKGRRNQYENDIDCAIREFVEETGYSKKDINLITNLIAMDEIFTGSNFKSYKHRYFIGHISNVNKKTKYQKSEVSKINWFTLEECKSKIRPYNLERIELIENTEKALEKYSLIL